VTKKKRVQKRWRECNEIFLTARKSDYKDKSVDKGKRFEVTYEKGSLGTQRGGKQRGNVTLHNILGEWHSTWPHVAKGEKETNLKKSMREGEKQEKENTQKQGEYTGQLKKRTGKG